VTTPTAADNRSRPLVDSDTIAAIATPPGEGAIGIVRMSGPGAFDAAARFFRAASGKPLAPARGMVYGRAIDADGEPLDEVLLLAMPAPHSYTCEDVVEIQCHGGAAPLRAVLDACLRAGARLAEPGEFTRRAYLNGRIDLVQAEAVIDRIRARTGAALRAANAAAGGALSRALSEMTDDLRAALARVEAAVDFPEEDVPELVDAGLRERIASVAARMDALLARAEAGRLLREGAALAIVGLPNAGKSSLFNALLRDARAIVTEIPGTTRDRLEETLSLGGVPVRLMDTAGLREAADAVERIGVDRARESLAEADLIALVVDGAAPQPEAEARLARECLATGAQVVCVANKADLAPPSTPPWADACAATVALSALTGEGLDEFEATLARIIQGSTAIDPNRGLITRLHQQDALRRAREAVGRVLDGYAASPEFLSIDLRECLQALGEITGETTPDDLLDLIFGEFCIGK
jgi:tRNA modification GTPase